MVLNMNISLSKQFFTSKKQVLDDISDLNLWPTTYVSGPSEGAPLHWHDYDVTVYIMEGTTDFLDGASSQRIEVSAGDKIVVPKDALHAEGAVTDRVVYIIGLPNAVFPEEFLQMREPE